MYALNLLFFLFKIFEIKVHICLVLNYVILPYGISSIAYKLCFMLNIS